MLKKFVSLILCLLIIISVAGISFSGVSAADDEVLIIHSGDSTYTANVGDTVTFAVDVKASRLFENIQGNIVYDSGKLKVTPVESDDPDMDDWDAAGIKCIPNLADMGSAYINLKVENNITFNASRVAGYNFKEKRNLLNVEFKVVSGGETEIDFEIIWMMIKGGNEGYFVNGLPEITEGLSMDIYVAGAEEYIPVMPTYPSFDNPATPEEAPGEIPEDAGTLVVFTDGDVYEVKVGQKFRYDILLQADRLIETLQGSVEYPSEMLEITRLESADPDVRDWEYQTALALPNINNAIANLGLDSLVKYNGSNIYGYNFKDEKVLITLEFTAVKEGVAEIESDIQELIIRGGEDYYFDNSQAGTTDGISIRYLINADICENPPERPTDPPVTYPTTEGEVTVHFENHYRWENVYCYTYVADTGEEPMGPWPGTLCENVKDKDFVATIPGYSTHILFNDGGTQSTSALLNPLEEKIAKRFGSAGHMVEGIKMYSFAWFEYDPNPTYPTVNPGYTPDYTQVATEYPWEGDMSVTESPTEPVVRPQSPAKPPSADDTYPPTVAPTAGDFAEPTAAPDEAPETSTPADSDNQVMDTPQTGGKPKPTEGATSNMENGKEEAVDVPTTGINATTLFPVVIIMGAALILMLRKRQREI